MSAKMLFGALIVAGMLCLGGCPHNPPNYPTKPIELKYYGTGPWAVSVNIGGYCCDSANHKFDVYYPTNLGANGFMHPILTWGNGTLGSTNQVDFFLRHMASWGFAVVATEDQFTGPGQTILDAANFMVHANSDPASPFFHKLSVSQIGAFGASQGAGGAGQAFIKSSGLIKTVMPIELPARVWCTLGPNCFEPANLTGGSVFFIDGSADIPISPPTQSQPPAIIGEQSLDAFYDATPNNVHKLRGTLIGPSHSDVTGQPDCSHAQFPCINGVYGYLGYPTAWFMDQLQGDTYAHGAFVNGTGEIFSENSNWTKVASNIPYRD